jgi:hypothetical protein
MLGIGREIWMIGGGIALLAISLMIVNRFDLYRKGPILMQIGNRQHGLPAIAAIITGLAGGALFFLGMRAG